MITKRYSLLLLSIGLMLTPVLLTGYSQKRSGDPRILVFIKTAGYHHKSIPNAIKAVKKLGAEHGIKVDTTTKASKFTEDNLKNYAAVVFLLTSGTSNLLNYRQKNSFKRYVEAGGGVVGVHTPTDILMHWPWFGKLIGARFKDHPPQQQAVLNVHKDANFPVTDSLPARWVRTDEWYNFKSPPENVHVLVDIDESSYRASTDQRSKGGTNSSYHPLVWYHNYDGGRVFYMELGHTKASYREPNFLNLLLAGIQYAISSNEKLDYSKVATPKVPAENRFTKQLLAGDLNEPQGLTVLPDLSVLIAERKGDIKYYNAETKKITRVAHLDVFHHYNGKSHHQARTNREADNGLMNIVADPNYATNHWIYVYYAPKNTPIDQISRFKFKNGNFDVNSEQVILKIPMQRAWCCHTAGGLAFGPKGDLYISIGGKTLPFNEVNPKTGKQDAINLYGYAPLDDRPGYEHFDAQRATGNTNDLRGKILRIKVNKDGSYSIPKGNLFPKGTPKTKPEIYTMGLRNPYHISVDQHTGYLYWGDVGPDAGSDSLATRGPRGYDEINQARRPGNFGYPFFIGNNYPYHQYNYATGKSGRAFNPAHPINDSRNNDGLRKLPPVRPAFIWYPYAKSKVFPILGQGSRAAMVGPVYYIDDYPGSTRYPDYYNGKLFIYDFSRNWIMAVTMYQHGPRKGDLKQIEAFMPHQKFHGILGMQVGPDGRLYIVEYGNNRGYYRKNTNSGLYVIKYNADNSTNN